MEAAGFEQAKNGRKKQAGTGGNGWEEAECAKHTLSTLLYPLWDFGCKVENGDKMNTIPMSAIKSPGSTAIYSTELWNVSLYEYLELNPRKYEKY